MSLKGLIQVILLVWFIVVNASILIPSWQMLYGTPDRDIANRPPPTPPLMPPAPAMPPDTQTDAAQQPQRLEVYKQQAAVYAEQVKSYANEVAAYAQQVAAYKLHEEARQKAGRVGTYELVVKGTLVTILGSFAVTLVGYVFANLGAGVVDNFARLKNGAPPQPLRLL
jgi:hypothetical protein